MPSNIQTKKNRNARKKAARSAKADEFLEHEAMFDDELSNSLFSAHLTGEQKEIVKRAPKKAPTSREKGKTTVGESPTPQQPEPHTTPDAAPSGAADDEPVWEDVEEVLDDWEMWIRDEVAESTQQSEPVLVFDVGAGDRGIAAAEASIQPMHCLCPIVIPHDLHRKRPQVGPNSGVTVCSHKLSDCTCLGQAPWIAKSVHSLYYLGASDLNRFEPGDRLLVEFSTYPNVRGRSEHGPYEVREAEHEGRRVRVVKQWTRNRPWDAYYHVDISGVVNGIRVSEDLYAYFDVRQHVEGKYRGTFRFSTQRLSWGEFDACDILSFAKAKELFETAPPPPGAAAGPTASAAIGKETSVVALSTRSGGPGLPAVDMTGPQNTPAARPLSNGVAAVEPVPAAPAVSKSDSKPDSDEKVVETIRAIASGLGTKGGVDKSLEMFHAVQRKFRTRSPEDIQNLIARVIQEVRDAQIALAVAATAEEPKVRALNGEVPSLCDRLVATITPGHFGSGDVVGATKRKVKRPFEDKRRLISLVDTAGGPIKASH